MSDIAIITNIIPIYREGFYKRLFSCKSYFTTVYCQKDIRGSKYQTIHHKYPENVHLIDYCGLKNGLLVWQFLPIFKILKTADIIFIDGNPRIISQSLFATFLRLFNKKVVIWSMIHSHNNNKLTETIRIAWLRLFKYHFLYNDSEIPQLRSRGGFDSKVIKAMNNGLDQKLIDFEIKKWPIDTLNEWKYSQNLNNKSIIVSCGRLLKKNEYHLILHALSKIVEVNPTIFWVCIGDGPERNHLERLTIDLNLEKHVLFVGELYNEADLCPWFLSSKVFVHPAAIGLSIIQAFGFGLPLITHGKSEIHGPEYVAFENEKTGLNFEKGNALDLAEKILQLLDEKENLNNLKENVLHIARTKYNSDVMYSRFLEMVDLVNGNN